MAILLLVGYDNVTTVLLEAEIKMSNGFPTPDYHFTLYTLGSRIPPVVMIIITNCIVDLHGTNDTISA